MARAILTDPAASLPQFAQLLGGYFHQDWPLDHTSWEEVVDEYVAAAGSRTAHECAAEVRRVLEAGLSDTELAVVLDALGDVDPAAFDLSAEQWTQAVLRRLPA